MSCLMKKNEKLSKNLLSHTGHTSITSPQMIFFLSLSALDIFLSLYSSKGHVDTQRIHTYCMHMKDMMISYRTLRALPRPSFLCFVSVSVCPSLAKPSVFLFVFTVLSCFVCPLFFISFLLSF